MSRDRQFRKRSFTRPSSRWVEGLDPTILAEARRTADARAHFLQRNYDAALRVQGSNAEQIAMLETELASIRGEYRRVHPLKALLGSKLVGKFKGIETDLLEKIRKLQEKQLRFEGRIFTLPDLISHIRAGLHSNSIAISEIDKKLRAIREWEAEKEKSRVAEERQQAKEAREKQKFDRVRRNAALAAERMEKQRELAETIKRTLPKDHPCPYCNGDLGESPHADHIYPISRGGFSVEWNMVLVCQPGNIKKKDMPLIEFILEYKLDAPNILRVLQTLGKKV